MPVEPPKDEPGKAGENPKTVRGVSSEETGHEDDDLSETSGGAHPLDDPEHLADAMAAGGALRPGSEAQSVTGEEEVGASDGPAQDPDPSRRDSAVSQGTQDAVERSTGETATKGRRKLSVGLIADPGLPLSFAMELKDSLPTLLERDLDPEVAWEVQVMEFSLPLDTLGELEINMHSDRLRKESSWDYLVYLTDLPKYENGEPLISSLNSTKRSAVIVLPALGIVRKKRLQRAMEQALSKLHGVDDPFLDENGRAPMAIDPLSVERRVEAVEAKENSTETAKGLLGRILLLIGMVRSNRPWLLVPQLSSAMAAALATGAFGVFYTSIWSMADYMPTRRLVLISLLSIMVIGTWLMAHNGLWERPRGSKHREKRVVYNLATLITLLTAILIMYLALFAVILTGALIIIDPAFLSLQIEGEAGFREYVNLSWLSASLGIVAGAVGSSFDNEESVRKATFSRREYERRQISLGKEAHNG